MTIQSSLVDANFGVPFAVMIVIAIAVFTDLKSRRIPNWLTVSALAGALVFHLATGGLSGLISSVCGFLTGFGVLLALFLIGGGGGGDVKLMGAVGAWIGAWPTILVFLGSAAFVLLLMIGLLVIKGPNHKSPDGKSLAKLTLPYAVPLALSLVTFLIVDSFTLLG